MAKRIGRARKKISKMLLDQLGIVLEPVEIWQNNTPASRMIDAARWGGYGYINGKKVNVHSWETMGDIIKCKKIVKVGELDDRFDFEVCRGD